MAVSRFIYTKEMIDYVRKIAPNRPNKEITKMFNEKFGLDKTTNQIKAMKSNHRIFSGNVRQKRSVLFTKEQEDFIKSNLEGKFDKEIRDMVNEKFGTNYKTSQISSLKSRRGWRSNAAKFTKGYKPWNKGMQGFSPKGSEKGWFKKGDVPLNYRPVGSERVDSKDGYIYVKVSDDGLWQNRWKHKHVVEWEKHHGEIPDNHVITFLDGDKTNTHISNLTMISRRTLFYLNRSEGLTDDKEENVVRIKLAELDSKVSKLIKTKSEEEKYKEYKAIAKSKGIQKETFNARLRKGWTFEEASS